MRRNELLSGKGSASKEETNAQQRPASNGKLYPPLHEKSNSGSFAHHASLQANILIQQEWSTAPLVDTPLGPKTLPPTTADNAFLDSISRKADTATMREKACPGTTMDDDSNGLGFVMNFEAMQYLILVYQVVTIHKNCIHFAPNVLCKVGLAETTSCKEVPRCLCVRVYLMDLYQI